MRMFPHDSDPELSKAMNRGCVNIAAAIAIIAILVFVASTAGASLAATTGNI